jgi:archaellum biogenesis ATPase FlaH
LNLGILTDTITRFLEKGSSSIVLLDGFDALVTYGDFKKALQTLDHLKDVVMATDSRLIVTIDRRTLSEKEASLIEKKAVPIQG